MRIIRLWLLFLIYFDGWQKVYADDIATIHVRKVGAVHTAEPAVDPSEVASVTPFKDFIARRITIRIGRSYPTAILSNSLQDTKKQKGDAPWPE